MTSLHPDVLPCALVLAVFALAVIEADGGLNWEVLQQSFSSAEQMVVGPGPGPVQPVGRGAEEDQL